MKCLEGSWGPENGSNVAVRKASATPCGFFSWLRSRGHIRQHRAGVTSATAPPSQQAHFWPGPWDPTDKATSRLDCSKTLQSTAKSFGQSVLTQLTSPHYNAGHDKEQPVSVCLLLSVCVNEMETPSLTLTLHQYKLINSS